MEDNNFIFMAIVFAGIVVLPVIIIRLAKSMKVLKEKKESNANKEA
jgi:hypothetical protein